MLQLGQTIGPYVVESLLAEGGMGAVYRAKNRVTGQLRAIKVVRPELAQKRDFVDRFVREATIASQLRHPNLVETLEPGIDGNVIYLPMELLEGETLAHHLKKKRRLTPSEAAELLVPVTEAVQVLHDRGLVHRDLKPMNVFITRGPNGALVPKVIDLGTAREMEDDEHTRTGMVVGSPFYMAPEQAEGRRDIDGRADQYALGVVAYQMITGARPYESDDTRSALAKLLRGEPYTLPSRHFPGLHPAVEAVIVRSLERERERRFARIADFGRALTAAAAGLPVPGLEAPASPPTMITPGPASASAAGAFVVPPALGAGMAGAPPGSAPSVPPGAVPLGTPGPFAPPPEGAAPAAAPPRSRAAVLVAATIVLALLGVGAAGIAWQMSPTMTATPLAPRVTTVGGGAATEPAPVTVPGGPLGASAPAVTGAGAAATSGAADPAMPADGPGPGPTGAPLAAPGSTDTAPSGAAEVTAGASAAGATAPPEPSGARTPGATPPEPSGTTTGSGARPTVTTGAGVRTGAGGRSTSDDGTTSGSTSRGSGRSGRTGGAEGGERGGGATAGAPCGAATGIPCLD